MGNFSAFLLATCSTGNLGLQMETMVRPDLRSCDTLAADETCHPVSFNPALSDFGSSSRAEGPGKHQKRHDLLFLDELRAA